MKNPTHPRGRMAVLATALMLPAMCFAHDYTYLEGGYLSLDNGPNDDSGFYLGASLNIAEPFAIIGEYNDAGNFEQISGGGVFHTPLNEAVDLNVGATFEHVEAGNADDTGFGLRAGIRWWALPGRLEVIPEVRYVDVFEDDATSLRATGLLRVTQMLDLQGMIQGGDDDRYGLGVRFNFGT